MQTAEGRLFLFVANDSTSKFAFVELHRTALRKTAADFLRHIVEAVPYKINIVLTDRATEGATGSSPVARGTHFTTPGAGSSGAQLAAEALAKGEPVRPHALEYVCATLGIQHRTTEPKHPWTNGHIERMNRTIKDATVKRFHYDDHDQLARHLTDFISAYNLSQYQGSLITPMDPIAHPDGGDAGRAVCETVPGFAAMLDDVVLVGEDAV